MMTESVQNFAVNTDDSPTKMKNSISSSRSSTPTNTMKNKRARLTFPFGACRVCSDSATGIHYGIATCEGCKGFFKRSILRKEKYRCYFDNSCLINVTNRNRCKACRFRRCIDEGMSVDGVKMGRIPKLVKERALREQKEQQMKQATGLTDTTEGHGRESSCSSISDRSIENDDPEIMETNVMDLQMSIARQDRETLKIHPSDNLTSNKSVFSNDQVLKYSRNLSEHDSNSPFIQTQKTNPTFIYRTKYPTFLPDDFTLDETTGLTDHSTGPISNEVFRHIQTIAPKLSENKTNLLVQLTEDEFTFIQFLRWSSHAIYLRYSTRVKQLESRMEQMIQRNITEYPGDNATEAQFFAAFRSSVPNVVRSAVFYIQELPGMTNMDSNSLQKLILHRVFDWYMLRYNYLFNENGQSYYVSHEGFQCTRRWMNLFYGTDLTDAIFKFSEYIRELNLTETEISLLIPLQMCHSDSTIEDQETPKMLRACYLYALYDELCRNHGEEDGTRRCGKILHLLDYLVPLNEMYEKNVGSQLVQV